MFLSRAEMLKQGAGTLQPMSLPDPVELSQWQELYGRLFATLQTHFLSLFPPVAPVTALPNVAAAADDMYVWQFLAAMAVGASMEQQHVLVTEVRWVLLFRKPFTASFLLTLMSCERFGFSYTNCLNLPTMHDFHTRYRERVLENVVAASSNLLPADKAAHKIANVNLFLHALGLDASQVTIPAA